MKAFVSNVDYLLDKVVRLTGSRLNRIRSSFNPPEKLNIYRLILTWLSVDNIIRQKKMPLAANTVDLSANADPFTAIRHFLRPYSCGLGAPVPQKMEILYTLNASKVRLIPSSHFTCSSSSSSSSPCS
jgi:hypothetical protein